MRIVLVLTLCLLAGCEGIAVDEAAGNTPPQISGTPESSVLMADVYEFASADGAISLSWDAPTENSDGSPLIDLAGYVIHYGESPGSYDREIRLDNPGLTRYMVEDLLPGTYYLAATSFNSAGVESFLSEEVESRVN